MTRSWLGLRGEGIEFSYVRKIKRNVMTEGVRSVTLLLLWVITITKNKENMERLKSLKGIFNLVIKVQ